MITKGIADTASLIKHPTDISSSIDLLRDLPDKLQVFLPFQEVDTKTLIAIWHEELWKLNTAELRALVMALMRRANTRRARISELLAAIHKYHRDRVSGAKAKRLNSGVAASEAFVKERFEEYKRGTLRPRPKSRADFARSASAKLKEKGYKVVTPTTIARWCVLWGNEG